MRGTVGSQSSSRSALSTEGQPASFSSVDSNTKAQVPSLQISSQLRAVISAAGGLGLQPVIGRGELVATIFNHALRHNYLEAVCLLVSYKY